MYKYKAMHECARTHTHARTTDDVTMHECARTHTHAITTGDVTTENTEQKKRMFACYLVLSGKN